ncbi:hypothetical protein KIN20_006897 [Parelaphostrongylus tenuis]|uniref:Uncharacterized protein n=1 Tax=Parelaphostrongylus tenuis TaxID=148309 RepID=A0AAD5QLD7_PARTN|nr:hypothetical protein KIN20_006897 [Parelaphostrongylus tenuis]
MTISSVKQRCDSSQTSDFITSLQRDGEQLCAVMSSGQEEWEASTAMSSGDEDWQIMIDSLAVSADDDTGEESDAIMEMGLNTSDGGAENGGLTDGLDDAQQANFNILL